MNNPTNPTNKYLDSRYFKPNPNSYRIYPVIFLDKSINSLFYGYAGAMPINGYTESTWGSITYDNGKEAEDVEVLYFMEVDYHLPTTLSRN